MEVLLTFLDLAGTVALLLWGVRMVQTGVQRAFGPRLRGMLAAALGSRPRAFLAGLGATAILQSSTATGLMVTSLAASGAVGLVPALTVMLGANVGSTLIVQLLSFDVSRLAPLLVLGGFLLFRRSATQWRDLGRVGIGLGLMLMALHQMLAVLAPLEQSPALRAGLDALAAQPVLALLLAAALTWAAHSSVAVVLLVMSLAAHGLVAPAQACVLVLGANLGTAINPVLEGSGGDDPAARRLPLGNLLARALGCFLALPLLAWLEPLAAWPQSDPARAVANFHTAFNLLLALLLFPVLPAYARLLRRLLPARVDAADPARPRHLDRAALETPVLAIGAAAREAMRLADALEEMLEGVRDALLQGDRRRIATVRRMDDVLDRLNGAIKAYLLRLDPEALSEADRRRVGQILAFATNLEHAGDVVERNLMPAAARRLKRGLPFSPEGEAELLRMTERVRANLRVAASVFMTEDARAARHLAAEKEAFRELEAQAVQAHFERLRQGQGGTAETSALHLDLLRDLKRLNAHLVAAAAYPVLEEQGELLPTRLRPAQDMPT
ncbi:Na/Pi cotransporter family protein [Pseudoroseomonas oryzae]|uniref:Na/Pi cotransporter family protein n=2 Tax=Teichococcus oryzae TaxID=1608942 RepID=A0A5B2TMR0_9PROT|nr:Na/Pi cotransporter family protein [Pseudoroseomonas oryzae]